MILWTVVIFRLVAAYWQISYIRFRIDNFTFPHALAKSFGLPASNVETVAYVSVSGIREIGFGAAVLLLLAGSSIGFLADGDRAAAIVMAVRAGVELADGIIVGSKSRKKAVVQVVGSAVEGAIAVGLLMSAKR